MKVIASQKPLKDILNFKFIKLIQCSHLIGHKDKKEKTKVKV